MFGIRIVQTVALKTFAAQSASFSRNSDGTPSIFDTKRDAARENHVPEIVLYLIFAVASGSMVLVGFGCGVGHRRHIGFTTLAAVLMAAAILVIMDLDRPRRGIIEVSQQPHDRSSQ